VEKAIAVWPLVLSLLGWGGTTYMNVMELKQNAKVEQANLKIMIDLARNCH